MNKKIILPIISSFLILGLLVNINKNETKNDTYIYTTVSNTNGINIQIKELASESNYGVKSITYNVYPHTNTDKILYKIKYVDNSQVEDDILSINHDEKNRFLTIKCFKPFTKKIVLTLYAELNENINASIELDFVEKISPTFSLITDEEGKLSIDVNLNSTDGSLKVDKQVKEESLKLNKTFINKANEYLKEDSFIFLKTNAPFYEDDTFYYYLGDYFDDGENTAYKQYISDMKGFESTINDKNINLNTYTIKSFLDTLYSTISINYITLIDKENDREVNSFYNKENINIKMPIVELEKNHFEELFNGENVVFDYTCKINDVQYKSSFGLKVSSLEISKITSYPSLQF